MPNVILEVCLGDHLNTGPHGRFSILRHAIICAFRLTTGKLISEISKMRQVCGFMLKPSLLKNGDGRIMPVRLFNLTAYRKQVQ